MANPINAIVTYGPMYGRTVLNNGPINEFVRCRVYPGDPGYTRAAELHKAGFIVPYLDRGSFETGVPSGGQGPGIASISLENWTAMEQHYTQATAVLLPCVHRWRLDTPQPGSDTVAGTCRYCQVTHTFKAYIDWDMPAIVKRSAEEGKALKAIREEASQLLAGEVH